MQNWPNSPAPVVSHLQHSHNINTKKYKLDINTDKLHKSSNRQKTQNDRPHLDSNLSSFTRSIRAASL